jgi:hypothetical protein
MTDTGFLFGPLGYMQPLAEVTAGTTRAPSRARGELVTVGGVRYVQKAKYAPRQWDLGYTWKTPAVIRLLMAAAQGVLKDCWLYDVAAARANMLPAHLTTGTGPTVLVAGMPLGALAAGTVVTVPLLAGRIYTASAWSAHAAGDTVFTRKFGTDSTVATVAPAGSGVRVTSVTLAPSSNQNLVVTVGSGADVSGLRVHEGAADGDWLPGHGSPCKVDVIDPQAVLQMVTDGHGLTDYTVSLQEVGQPGVI